MIVVIGGERSADPSRTIGHDFAEVVAQTAEFKQSIAAFDQYAQSGFEVSFGTGALFELTAQCNGLRGV